MKMIVNMPESRQYGFEKQPLVKTYKNRSYWLCVNTLCKGLCSVHWAVFFVIWEVKIHDAGTDKIHCLAFLLHYNNVLTHVYS